MRVIGDGIQIVAEELEFTFEGETLKGYAGETVAASLTAAGKLGLRETKDGSKRGIFCGMGVCNECLVSIDGQQNIRACMTGVRGGMRIEIQKYPGAIPGPDVPHLAEPPSGEMPVHRPDVLVIGGGPAGLSAAYAAAAAGAEVMLIDERPALGGQFYKQLSKAYSFASESAMDKQFRAGRDLIEMVRSQGVKVFSEALVWGAFGPQEIAVLADGLSQLFEPKQLVVATGAYERGLPVPGWTLPGFMTTGAAQTLLRSYRVAPGRRVLMAGNGPLNLQVAYELAGAGVEVVALAEAAKFPNPSDIAAAWTALSESPDLIVDGWRYMWRLKRAGVPMLYRHIVVEAHGTDRVESVTVQRIDRSGKLIEGTRREFEVDAVCVGYGFQPSADVSRPLGCKHRYDADKGTLVIEKDGDCETSIPGVFVAGDSGGLGGARAAVEEGFIAGCAAARNLERELPPAIATELGARRRRLVSHRRFQEALWAMYQTPRLMDELAADNTLICRCEEVSRAAINEALASGTSTVGGVKRQTRAGMGRCQGRYCGPVMAHLVSGSTESEIEEFSFFAPRPPIKPVPISAIARKPPDD